MASYPTATLFPRLKTSTLNINLKRNVTFQSVANTYGAKGAWTNLYFAVLAYDGGLTQPAQSTTAMEVEIQEGLANGINQDLAAKQSKKKIASVGCEYSLYFKEC